MVAFETGALQQRGVSPERVGEAVVNYERLRAAPPYGPPLDVVDLINWCRSNGYHDAADYVQWALQLWWEGQHVALWLPEPIALYHWAAHRLRRLSRELAEDRLSPESLQWLAARLNETRLTFTGRAGELGRSGKFLRAAAADQCQ